MKEVHALLVIVWVTIRLHLDVNQFVYVDLELTYMVNEYGVSFLVMEFRILVLLNMTAIDTTLLVIMDYQLITNMLRCHDGIFLQL